MSGFSDSIGTDQPNRPGIVIRLFVGITFAVERAKPDANRFLRRLLPDGFMTMMQQKQHPFRVSGSHPEHESFLPTECQGIRSWSQVPEVVRTSESEPRSSRKGCVCEDWDVGSEIGCQMSGWVQQEGCWLRVVLSFWCYFVRVQRLSLNWMVPWIVAAAVFCVPDAFSCLAGAIELLCCD